MEQLPSGTVTFLFTDIEDSAGLWDRHPGVMPDALARHDSIVTTAIRAKGGYIFATGGDSFSAAFARPMDALEAAIEIQDALAGEDWSDLSEDLRARMALHTGIADERDGDYFGPPVNRTARVLSLADGGDVLISQTTMDLLRHHLQAAGLATSDLGEKRLKGVGIPERIHALDRGPGRRRKISWRSMFAAGGVAIVSLAALLMVVVPSALNPEDDETAATGSSSRTTALTSGTSAPEPLATGNIRWSEALGSPTAGMAADGGVLYVVTAAGSLVAFDLETGERFWDFDAGGPVKHPPAVSGGVVYLVTTSGNRLYGVTDGQARLRCSFNFLEPGPVSVVDGTIYLGAGEAGTLHAVDGAADLNCDPGFTTYDRTGLLTITTAPVTADGKLFVGDSRGDVQAFRLDDLNRAAWSKLYFTGEGQRPAHESGGYQAGVVSLDVHEVERVGAASRWTDVTVLVADAEGWLHFVDGAGEEGGKAALEKKRVIGVPFVRGTEIHYLESDSLVTLDADLEEEARFKLPAEAALGPVLVDDVAFYGTTEGTVIAVEARTGVPLMRHVPDTSAAWLTAIGGGVAIVDEAGTVSVVDLPDASLGG